MLNDDKLSNRELAIKAVEGEINPAQLKKNMKYRCTHPECGEEKTAPAYASPVCPKHNTKMVAMLGDERGA